MELDDAAVGVLLESEEFVVVVAEQGLDYRIGSVAGANQDDLRGWPNRSLKSRKSASFVTTSKSLSLA